MFVCLAKMNDNNSFLATIFCFTSFISCFIVLLFYCLLFSLQFQYTCNFFWASFKVLQISLFYLSRKITFTFFLHTLLYLPPNPSISPSHPCSVRHCSRLPLSLSIFLHTIVIIQSISFSHSFLLIHFPHSPPHYWSVSLPSSSLLIYFPLSLYLLTHQFSSLCPPYSSIYLPPPSLLINLPLFSLLTHQYPSLSNPPPPHSSIFLRPSHPCNKISCCRTSSSPSTAGLSPLLPSLITLTSPFSF